MIVQLSPNISSKQKNVLFNTLTQKGLSYKTVKTQVSEYLIITGNTEFDIRLIGNMKGVKDIHRVDDCYRLVSSKWKVKPTRIEVNNTTLIGGNRLSIIAGPCSIESREQVERTARFLKHHSIQIMRGGVFKPRSSPYTFRGMGIDGLRMFHEICRYKGIGIISEVMEPQQIEAMYDYVDIFQVGARNSQNFNLLEALGKTDKPVLIKRGISGTIDELLHSAEYVFSGGNEKIILCERGIRTYEKAYRNTFDINAIPILKAKTHLPVIVDPSHGTGVRQLVEPIALAGIMAGADGVIMEIHENPDSALSDGKQSLCFYEAAQLFEKMEKTFRFKKELS